MELTLYQAESTLAAMIETEDGGIPAELEREFREELAEWSEKAIQKRDNVIRFIRFIENQIAFSTEEEKRLAERRRRLTNSLDNFRAYVARIIQECAPDMRKGAKRLEGRTGTLAAVKNPDSVEVYDALQLPPDFVHIELRLPGSAIADLPEEMWDELRKQAVEYGVVPQKANIAAALRAGRDVPGARWATGKMRLEIR